MLTLLVAALLALPALVAGVTAIGFPEHDQSGTARDGRADHLGRLPRHRDLPDRGRSFGIPLLIATFGAIVPAGSSAAGAIGFAASDVVLALCGIVVAIYLVAIYGTAARNSVGTPFVPIGVAFAATAGLRHDPGADAPRGGPRARHHHRRLPRLHLHRASAARHPRGAERLYLAALLRPCLFGCGHPRADNGGLLDLHHPLHHLRGLPAGLQGGRLLRQLRLRRCGRARGGPGEGGDLRLRPDGHDQRHLARATWWPRARSPSR
jgi:hypothetical protein